jgi:hypothetical protein
MLRPEVERHETHPILALKQLTAAEIVDGLRVQLDAFWQNEWPFDQQVENNNPLSWWESLRYHSHARVLAVCILFISWIFSQHHESSIWPSNSSQFWSTRCLMNGQTLESHGSILRFAGIRTHRHWLI